MTSPPREPGNAMTSSQAMTSSPRTSSAPAKASSSDLSYMHRPPGIIPNYGKKYSPGIKLKTNVPRVLLYDNVTQQTILSVQLSGLQSQQYKTHRELEMHKRSFKLRRQVKVRQLDKLTRVTHSEDYDDFQREYSSLYDNDVGPKSNGGLPKINAKVKVGHGKRKPKNKYKREVSNVSKGSLQLDLNTIDNVSRAIEPSDENSENPDTGTATLPKIDVSVPNSLVTSTEQMMREIISTSVHQFDPKRRVAFKEERSSSGVTRLFHSLPTEDQQVSKTDTDNPPAVEECENVQSGNLFDNSINHDVSASPRHDTSSLSVMLGQPTTRRQSYDDPFRERNTPTFRLRPLLDQRYETLRRMLVPQEPPNEGYAELSPSFVRQYPDWADRYRISSAARRRLIKKKKKKAKPGFGEDLSEGETPSLNEDRLSESEDELDVNENQHCPPGALNSLGNF